MSASKLKSLSVACVHQMVLVGTACPGQSGGMSQSFAHSNVLVSARKLKTAGQGKTCLSSDALYGPITVSSTRCGGDNFCLFIRRKGKEAESRLAGRFDNVSGT